MLSILFLFFGIAANFHAAGTAWFEERKALLFAERITASIDSLAILSNGSEISLSSHTSVPWILRFDNQLLSITLQLANGQTKQVTQQLNAFFPGLDLSCNGHCNLHMVNQGSNIHLSTEPLNPIEII